MSTVGTMVPMQLGVQYDMTDNARSTGNLNVLGNNGKVQLYMLNVTGIRHLLLAPQIFVLTKI